jgi:hypothetical protein
MVRAATASAEIANSAAAIQAGVQCSAVQALKSAPQTAKSVSDI